MCAEGEIRPKYQKPIESKEINREVYANRAFSQSACYQYLYSFYVPFAMGLQTKFHTKSGPGALAQRRPQGTLERKSLMLPCCNDLGLPCFSQGGPKNTVITFANLFKFN